MTAEEKRKAAELYAAGKSMEEIAKELNYCRATISRNLPSGMARRGRKAKGIIYPYIEKWMQVNNVSIAELNRRMFGNNNPHMFMILHGKIMPNKVTIDKILAETGLTYEEAFRTAEDVNAHE